MKRLSIDALSTRSEQVQSDALLAKISGGTENDCHDDPGYVDGVTSPFNRKY